DIMVSSETARLRSVVVHTPGREVSLVSPDVKQKLLFDDIIFEADAKIEHQNMLALFEKAIGRPEGVIQITDLIQEAFEAADARSHFIQLLLQELPTSNLRAIERRLDRLEPHELLEFAV